MLLPRLWTRLASGLFIIVAFLLFTRHATAPKSLQETLSQLANDVTRDDSRQAQHRLQDEQKVVEGGEAQKGDLKLDDGEAQQMLIMSSTISPDSSPAIPTEVIVVQASKAPDVDADLPKTEASSTTTAVVTNTPTPEPSLGTLRKTIVMGKLTTEDTDWVRDELSDWDSAIYLVDLPANETSPTGLRTKINKSKEAMPYLTYIVEHYDNFPDIAVFLHAHRDGWPRAWHNDAPNYDAVTMLQKLRLDTVRKRGYVNLRCMLTPGCPAEIRNNIERIKDGKHAEEAYPYVYGQFFNMTVEEVREQVPVVASPCCAQFAVSKQQVLQRPKAEYERFVGLIEESKYDDETLGTVMEYMWHIMFGRDPVFCEQTTTCWADVYGRGRGRLGT